MSALGVFALALFLAAVGRLVAARLGLGGSWPSAFGVHLASGLVLLHILLVSSSAVGVPWRFLAPLLPLGLLVLGWAWWRRRGEPELPKPARGERPALGAFVAAHWGDAAALLALATFAGFIAVNFVNTSDFIYHWGTKARRFVLRDGIDYAFLAEPDNWRVHPDYPNLFPSLLAATARLLGSFAPRALQLWNVVILGALLLEARRALGAARDRFVAQSGVAILGLGLCAFGITWRMGGGADWLPAWALVLAVPALVAERPGAAEDWRLGIAAALAAGSKIEGLPLAALMGAVYLLRRSGGRPWRLGWRPLARTALLPALTVVPWLVPAQRLHLFVSNQASDFAWSRLSPMLAGIRQVLLEGPWLYLPFLFALVPLLLLSRRWVGFAVVCLAQLGLYLFVYLASPFDTVFYVLNTLARLILHLLPASLVVLLLAADARFAGRSGRGVA